MITGASGRQQTPYRCQIRNQGLCASISSCLRFAAERSLRLSGLVSCTAKMRSRNSISAIVCSVSISVSLSSMSVAFVNSSNGAAFACRACVRASERPTPDLHKQQQTSGVLHLDMPRPRILCKAALEKNLNLLFPGATDCRGESRLSRSTSRPPQGMKTGARATTLLRPSPCP